MSLLFVKDLNKNGKSALKLIFFERNVIRKFEIKIKVVMSHFRNLKGKKCFVMQKKNKKKIK